MSTVTLSQIAVAALFSVVLLLGAPARLMHPGPWVAFVAAVVTLMTQPALRPGEVVGDKTDRMSALAIFLGVVGCQAASVLQFGYREALTPSATSPMVVFGVMVVALGLGLRLWAIRTLGQFFTSTVHVAEGQDVIDTGPYRLLRHPSYTGTIIHCVGLSIVFASVLGFAFVLVLVVPAYLYRISVEERVLVGELGVSYDDYRARTWRLVPFIY